MRRQVIKITAISVLSVVLAAAVVVAAFYVRLSQGPVALDFMTGTIKGQINKNLAGMTVDIDGALVERDTATGVPHFRLSNITLRDAKGNLIARAPKAAIGIDESAIFTGSLVPRSLDLIGPRIFITRNLDGAVELGFGTLGGSEAPQSSAVPPPDGTLVAEGKTDQQPAGQAGGGEALSGASLIAILAGDANGGQSSLSTIEDIRVTDASIKLFDEANDAIWSAPEAQLAFHRMPYGFAVVTNAAIANGNEGGTWRAEISASYRRESRSFSVSSRISDLVPANVSDQIFALSKLARVKVPLSGHAEVEVTDQGVITKATAEFAAAAGEVGLPDYLAEPIIVDEGSLRADYDPATGGVKITDATLLVGGSKAELTGSVVPERKPDGRLKALQIELKAKNAAIDAQGTVVQAVAVDRIDFSGTAAIDEAKLDIGDLLVMSGNTGIRLRGSISGGAEGIQISGRVRDVSAALLKRLWPPVIAPRTRQWMSQNIQDGHIGEGEFRVNLTAEAMDKAQRLRWLPDNSLDFHFLVSGVTTGYFKDLPPLTNAAGEVRLKDNVFSLTVDGADVTLPSGEAVKLKQGAMTAEGILLPSTPATFTFDVASSAGGLLEYLNLPALSLINDPHMASLNLSGDAAMSVVLKLPLNKPVPRDEIDVSATAKLTDASLKGILPKIDITGGQFNLTLKDGALDAKGPAKINGVDAVIAWRREPGADGKQSASIDAVLDAAQRKKIGVDLDDFLSGPVSINAKIADLSDPTGTIAIDANLAKADMHLGVISWSREAQPKTHATFLYHGKGDKGRSVEDLDIEGPGVAIKGDIGLDANGALRNAKLTEVDLSDENRFALSLKKDEDGASIQITGDSFDARPLINSMFGSRGGGGGDDAGPAQPLSISANVDRVYAYRGEIVTGVTAQIQSRGGKVQSAEISGTFLSGQPIVLHIVPVSGGRELRLAGRDGGAALRAANLYSKIAGGQIEFYALLENDPGSSVKNGQLVLRNFEVRNEAALAQLDTKGKPIKTGPRREGVAFNKLSLPFTTDERFVRVGDSLIKGSELGATAEGVIRKGDGAIDITGTIIPAYALNSMLSGIPLVGDIIAGGRGQGVIGLTFALGGSVDRPKFQVNPVSAIAPGILRKFFEYGGTGNAPQSTNRNTDKSG